MNILFLADEIKYTSGVTTHLYNLLNGLSSYSGNRYYLICGSCSAGEKFNGVDVEICENKNFLHGNRSLRNFFNAMVFLRQYCKKNKIDIIHSHTHYAANIAYHTSYTVNVCTVQTNHGILPLQGRVEHFKAQKYVAINEHIYDYLLNNNIAEKSAVSFIRCGIPVPEKPVEKNLNGKIKFISASRFSREKGIDIYIKAVGILPDEYKKKAEFYLAGEGELENELILLNGKLNTGINFLGSQKNLADFLIGTQIFIYPSRSVTEGFPAVITEAAARGNLIITSDFYGLRSVFEDGVDGFVFKVNDEHDLSSKIMFVIDNYKTLEVSVLRFYTKVKELFDLNAMVEKHIRLYEECLRN